CGSHWMRSEARPERKLQRSWQLDPGALTEGHASHLIAAGEQPQRGIVVRHVETFDGGTQFCSTERHGFRQTKVQHVVGRQTERPVTSRKANEAIDTRQWVRHEATITERNARWSERGIRTSKPSDRRP